MSELQIDFREDDDLLQDGRPIRYYFSRFNIIAIYENKKDFLLRGLTTSETIHKRSHTWGFFDIETVLDLPVNQDFSKDFISGYLVKYNPDGEEEEVANPITRQIEGTSLPNSVAAKARFFLHAESGLIAYYLKPGINRDQFNELFCELFQKGHNDFFVNADLQDIEESYNFFSRILRFDAIFKVSAYLHPSNPSNNDRWKKIDERLKRMNASSYRETIQAKNNSEGLNLEVDEEFNGKAHMAQDGYGKVKVNGLINGEPAEVATGESPVTALAPSEGNTRRILLDLLPTFRNIFQRTPNKGGEVEDDT